MNIIYNQNPLKTQVILNDHDREVLKLRIHIDELENKLISISLYLDEKNDMFDLQKAKEEANMLYASDSEERVKKLVNNMALEFEKELSSCHCGDCVCFACSCMKCIAECYMGIDTIPNLDKHSAHMVEAAFNAPNITTCQQAIDYMTKNPPTLQTGPEWEKVKQPIERWKIEHRDAIEFLIRYQKEKLNGQ